MKTQSRGIVLMIISAFATCIGQLIWKLSSINGTNLLYMAIGFALYGTGAMLMIIAFRFGEVSVLQPMLSIGFVFSLLLAVMVLHEKIDPQKMIGILFIVCGIIALSLSGKEKTK